jgi:NAD(P)-dependent dehydrogenase (short-subunit alcohol dehydrogenase family)
MGQGKVAFIVGGGSGIGRGVVERLARDGDDVCVVDLDIDAAEESAEIARSVGRRAISASAHAGAQQSIGAAVDRCVKEFGRLDHLVGCAAIHRGGPLLTMDLKSWSEILDTNLTGMFLTAQAAARAMVAAGNGGRIVCLSSAGSIVVAPGNWAYAATKAGIDIMVRHWAQELGRHGITVNAIAPGIVETPLIKVVIGEPGSALRHRADGQTAVGRIGQPADIAGLVSFLCGPDGAYMSGAYLLMDGGGRDVERDAPDDVAAAEIAEVMPEWLERAARLQGMADDIARAFT